jgi:coenzyme PQQ precursor peptide PqqA
MRPTMLQQRLGDVPYFRPAQRSLPIERQGITMQWTTPQFEEIKLNCEINSYASAEM